MTRPLALVVLVASVPLLAGCVPTPQLPAPITPAEAQQQVDDRNRDWWQSMFPDEPMPEVKVVEVLDPTGSGDRVGECLQDANIAGMRFSDEDNSWSYTAPDAGAENVLNRALFICTLRFPYDVSDPSRLGMLSDAEIGWLWGYNQERLVPCLRLLGYTVTGRSGDYVEGSGDLWIPYYEMAPIPSSNAEWDRIDLRCPPAPIGPNFRPSMP